MEGKKSIADLIKSDYKIHSLFATKDWINSNPMQNAFLVSEKELIRISNLKNPESVLALVKIKTLHHPIKSRVTLVLDGISDPGNLGTIIRICHWFGVFNIICSHKCVDCYSPKVVQSSMGSLFNVNIKYVNLLEYFESIDSVIFGAFTKGENIKKISFPENLHLVMGNEANGISPQVTELITKKVMIASKSNDIDSLNVAVATSILLNEICS